jgi:uncharacterized MAPEG superfamily protein
MRLTTELYWLAVIAAATALMWVPYILQSFVSRGILASMGNPSTNDPPPPAWADRARRAHMNAIANLASFAPIVLVAAAAGVSTPATVLAAKVYVLARIGHYVVYVIGIPVIRTVMFLLGLAAALTIAHAVLGSI